MKYNHAEFTEFEILVKENKSQFIDYLVEGIGDTIKKHNTCLCYDCTALRNKLHSISVGLKVYSYSTRKPTFPT